MAVHTATRRLPAPHAGVVLHLDEAWWISSLSRNVKVANLEQDPRASLALPDGDRALVAEGTAEIRRGIYPSDVTAAFANKYSGWDITDHVREGPRVLIRVQVQRWLMTGKPA